MEPRQNSQTSKMAAVGLSWFDLNELANHMVHLLSTQGETALHVVTGILKLIVAVTERDFSAIFVLINQEQKDIQSIIAAIKIEFGL